MKVTAGASARLIWIPVRTRVGGLFFFRRYSSFPRGGGAAIWSGREQGRVRRASSGGDLPPGVNVSRAGEASERPRMLAGAIHQFR